MQTSSNETASAQDSVKPAEKFAVAPERTNTTPDLRQRLEAFRRTHPYREVQVAGRRWRYVVGG